MVIWKTEDAHDRKLGRSADLRQRGIGGEFLVGEPPGLAVDGSGGGEQNEEQGVKFHDWWEIKRLN